MGPLNGAAATPGVRACGESGIAAKAGKQGSKPSVAVLTDVCLRNERRVRFVMVLSSQGRYSQNETSKSYSQERLLGNVFRTNGEKCRNRAEYYRLGLTQEVRA